MCLTLIFKLFILFTFTLFKIIPYIYYIIYILHHIYFLYIKAVYNYRILAFYQCNLISNAVQNIQYMHFVVILVIVCLYS